MDHNTRFAKSLGFFEDAPWPLETPYALAEDKLGAEDLEDSGRFSYLANDSDMSIADLPKPPSNS